MSDSSNSGSNGTKRTRAPILDTEEREALRKRLRKETQDQLAAMRREDADFAPWEAKTNPVIVQVMPHQTAPERQSKPDSEPPDSPKGAVASTIREFGRIIKRLPAWGQLIAVIALMVLVGYMLFVTARLGMGLAIFG